jgi:hypothetical protein
MGPDRESTTVGSMRRAVARVRAPGLAFQLKHIGVGESNRAVYLACLGCCLARRGNAACDGLRRLARYPHRAHRGRRRAGHRRCENRHAPGQPNTRCSCRPGAVEAQRAERKRLQQELSSETVPSVSFATRREGGRELASGAFAGISHGERVNECGRVSAVRLEPHQAATVTAVQRVGHGKTHQALFASASTRPSRWTIPCSPCSRRGRHPARPPPTLPARTPNDAHSRSVRGRGAGTSGAMHPPCGSAANGPAHRTAAQLQHYDSTGGVACEAHT